MSEYVMMAVVAIGIGIICGIMFVYWENANLDDHDHQNNERE